MRGFSPSLTTIYMFKIICVTNRALCKEDFLTRIKKLCEAGVDGIILREKDLSLAEYTALANSVLEVCRRYKVPCILHNFEESAIALNLPEIHMPLGSFRALPEWKKSLFEVIGVSCHSVEDALAAERMGASYLIAGHVFETDCKRGVPARGLDFLTQVVEETYIPVYAIGGITPENVQEVKNIGAAGLAGVCIMSSAMTCEDPQDYIRRLKGL